MKRTIHLSYVPDEEIGGHDGMQKFVHTQAILAYSSNSGISWDKTMADRLMYIPNDNAQNWGRIIGFLIFRIGIY